MKKNTIAHHEAGHAVVAFLLGRPFTFVTIVPAPGNLGAVVASDPLLQSIKKHVDLQGTVPEIVVSLAGYEAERLLSRRHRARVLDSDYHRAYTLAFVACESRGLYSEEDEQRQIYLRDDGKSLPFFTDGDDEEVRAYLQWLSIVAKRLLRGHWCAVESVAAALIARKRLSYREVTAIIREATRAGRPRAGAKARMARGLARNRPSRLVNATTGA